MNARTPTTLTLSGVLLLISSLSLAADPRGFVGGSLTLADPQGQFGDFVEAGGGLSGFGVLPLARQSPLALRVAGSVLLYGEETVTKPLSPDIGRVMVDVSTSNYIASLGLGPQLMLGSGRIRPYAFGTVGFSYFGTESSVSGTSSDHDFASSVNYDDFTLALASGGGVLIGLAGGQNPVSLDLSVHYLRNGRARYLREGSITDLPDGSIEFQPIESETNMTLFQVGVSVGL